MPCQLTGHAAAAGATAATAACDTADCDECCRCHMVPHTRPRGQLLTAIAIAITTVHAADATASVLLGALPAFQRDLHDSMRWQLVEVSLI